MAQWENQEDGLILDPLTELKKRWASSLPMPLALSFTGMDSLAQKLDIVIFSSSSKDGGLSHSTIFRTDFTSLTLSSGFRISFY